MPVVTRRVTVAQFDNPHCPRCYKPIKKLVDRIELYNEAAFGKKQWAHVGCKQAEGVPVSAAEQLAGVPSGRPAAAAPASAGGSDLRAAVAEALAERLEEFREGVLRDSYDASCRVKEELEAELRGLVERLVGEEAGAAPRVVEVRQHGRPAVTLAGEVFHPEFDWLIQLAAAGKPIFLPGPTGSGKTHTAEQLARALGRPFGLFPCNEDMTPTDLLGFVTPNVTTGEQVYCPTDFVRLYEGGGVFCLDEMDAANPNVLLKLNAALAQRKLYIPRRTEAPVAEMHPEFVLVATANTWGHGASREYCGRNPLDEATLDRFRIGTVPCDYNDRIEKAVCPDRELYSLLKGWRTKMRAAGVKRVISTRFFKDAFDMREAGASAERIKAALFTGWRPEEQAKVLGEPLGA
jgi:cobaltochelatase CobS